MSCRASSIGARIQDSRRVVITLSAKATVAVWQATVSALVAAGAWRAPLIYDMSGRIHAAPELTPEDLVVAVQNCLRSHQRALALKNPAWLPIVSLWLFPPWTNAALSSLNSAGASSETVASSIATSTALTGNHCSFESAMASTSSGPEERTRSTRFVIVPPNGVQLPSHNVSRTFSLFRIASTHVRLQFTRWP